VSVKTGGGASTPVTFSQLPADVCCQALVTGRGQRRAERVAILSEDMIGDDEVVHGYLQMAVNTLSHPVGTARMGRVDDANAVADQYGRVRGLDNVRVADASIMPNIPRANTNLTRIMIGERMADWMRAE
jgi:choline dehydrogenase